MADEKTPMPIEEPPPNPRVVHIEAELARTREKLEKVSQRMVALEQQVIGLEYQLEQELGRSAPAPDPAPAEE